jgi:hypothetical protein
MGQIVYASLVQQDEEGTDEDNGSDGDEDDAEDVE